MKRSLFILALAALMVFTLAAPLAATDVHDGNVVGI